MAIVLSIDEVSKIQKNPLQIYDSQEMIKMGFFLLKATFPKNCY